MSQGPHQPSDGPTTGDSAGSSFRKPADDSLVARDWFLPAIEANGTVAHCLDAVLSELSSRSSFIKAVKSRLAGQGKTGLDCVTELNQRIKAVENTLRFRLGMLHPDRVAAWFRPAASRTSGPFASALLTEPVFAPYEISECGKLQGALRAAWEKRVEGPLPFSSSEPCLWRLLLAMNLAHEQICVLPAPFSDLRLDRLPDGLPGVMESRSLRAFLFNVRIEVLNSRERLDACFKSLFEASERLWSAQARLQATKNAETKAKTTAKNPWRESAGEMREEFKKRRQSAQRRSVTTAADFEALRFMGFDAFPSGDLLRQRYLALAKSMHPDRDGGNEDKFKMLNKAYRHLSERVES